MKKVVYAFLLISASVLGQVKEERVVDDFISMRVSQGIQVEFTSGINKKMVVETDSKELLKHIKTEVKGKELRVFIENEEKKGFFKKNSLTFEKLVVYIENPQLEAVQVTSSGKVILKNRLKSRRFDVSVSSAGGFEGNVITDNLEMRSSSSGSLEGDFRVANKVTLEVSSAAHFSGTVEANTLSMEVSSSGKATVHGAVSKAEVAVSSSGKVDAENLKIADLKASASSSGKGVFTVSGSLDASASSLGSLVYYGDAKVIRSNTSSSGKISKK